MIYPITTLPLTIEEFRELWELYDEDEIHSDCGLPQQFENWLRDGDIEQLTKSLIRSYQERCYGPLNHYLRKEERPQNSILDLRTRLLNRALDALPPLNASVLWRNEGSDDEVKLWATKNIGKTFLIPSFWSTYINPENWKATYPTFKILVSTPSNAKEISSYTEFQRGETEALYKPNSLFRIVGIEEVITWGSEVEEVVIVEELVDGQPDIVAFEGYSVSQNDADHLPLPPLSASDLGWI